ncbi:MAG: TolB family protein, partial [Candidatus Zixiibacteriota bacterium]
AQVAAKIAEDSYLTLWKRFNHEIFSAIPLIIYSSPLYFSQTNTTPGMVSESTGGFTEFFKGRMVVPYTGSYAMFDHVIRHELVHVFTLSKLSRVQRDQRRVQLSLPPLWFIEGLAEFWSTSWDSQAEMMVSDMALSGKTLGIDEFYRIRGSFMMYKLGQSVCEFIDREYGSDKLILIFENWWKAKRFEEVLELTLGEPLAVISKKWEYSLKKKYFPMLAEGDLSKNVARQLTHEGYAVKSAPIMFDDGDGEREWIVYKADKLGYSSLYMMDGRGERRKVHTLLKGERSADFESLHLLSSGIDAHSNGLVAFSSKSKETDALYIYDLKRRRVERQIKVSGLVSIQSPRFSPDGFRVVLSGVDKSGAADLYLVDLKDDSSERLTNDFYQDVDPVFTNDGDTILFSSDRGPWGDRGARDIYALALDDRSLLAMTSSRFSDRAPEPTENGFFFACDRGGATNAYHCDSAHQFTQLTEALTGVYEPRVSPANGDLIYTGYQDFRFHIFRGKVTDSATPVSQNEFVEMGDDLAAWSPGVLSSESIRSSVSYDLDYSFDIAQTALSFDPVFGTLGGMQVRMSDMLGNHVFVGFLSNSAESRGDILTSFNVGVSYFNLEQRLNWGVGGFHLFDEFWNEVDGAYFERQLGGYGQLSYPISRYSRLETTMFGRYRDKDMFVRRRRLKQFLVSNFVSYIYDNSLWEPTGPIDGRRINLTLGITTSIHDQKINDVVALA